jgi:hypothetical protein
MNKRQYSIGFILASTILCLLGLVTFAIVWIYQSERPEPPTRVVSKASLDRSAEKMAVVAEVVTMEPQSIVGEILRCNNPSKPTSWRLGFLGLVGLLSESEYDSQKPWNSRAQYQYDDEHFDNFCFDDAQLRAGEKHYANFLAVRGDGTAFNLILDGTSLENIPSSSILLVESPDKAKIEWLRPVDYDKSYFDVKENLSVGNYEGGFLVAFADAQVWFLSDDTPTRIFSKFLTCDTAKQYDREELLGPYLLQKWND